MSGCSSLYVQEAQKEADCRIVLLRCRYTNLRGRLLVGGQGLLSGLHPLVPTWQAMGGCLYCTQSLLGWRSSCISPCHVWWIALKSFTCWTKRKCTSWQTVVGMLCNRDMDLDGWTLYGMVKRFFSLQKQRNDRSSHDTQPHPLVICVFPPRWLRRERLLLVSKWQTKERGEKSGKAMPKSKERLDRKIFP